MSTTEQDVFKQTGVSVSRAGCQRVERDVFERIGCQQAEPDVNGRAACLRAEWGFKEQSGMSSSGAGC